MADVQKTRQRKLSQARAEETRSRILQTARDAFAEHGFAGANVRDIAREAGTTHSMITYHFGTKDQLWREAVRDMFNHIREEVFEPLQQEMHATVEERFASTTRRYASYCARHPEHARITIQETIRGGERLEWMVNEFVKADHASADWLQELMDAGLVPEMRPESLLYIYVGMMQLPFVLAKEAEALGYDFSSEAGIERHASSVLKLMLRK